MRVGDMQVYTRTGLLPDPRKCRVQKTAYADLGDVVGVLGGQVPILVLVQWSDFPDHWVWSGPSGGPVAFGPDAKAEWFWLTDPPPLPWAESADLEGRSLWLASGLKITEFIGTNDEGTNTWYEVSGCGEDEVDSEYLTLDAAKAAAASVARNERTKRDEVRA